jgi:glycosyltransferase involved in cell wall biosynthesis
MWQRRTSKKGRGGQGTRILHVSFSDVRTDARIQRQVRVLQRELNDSLVMAVGFINGRATGSTGSDRRLPVRALPLLSRRVSRSIKHVRYLCCTVESMGRLVFECLRLRPAIIHCHDVSALPAGWICSLILRAKLVYDAHELESEQDGQSRVVKSLVLAVERWCWRRISLLISVSPPILDWYRDHVGPKQSILVLNSPLSPAPSLFGGAAEYGEPNYLRNHFDIPLGAKVFLYLGVMSPGRGLETVLRVFRRPGIRSHVVFMGHGDRVGVEDHARQFSNIHVHPSVAHDRVVAVVRGADCGLCLGEDVCLSYRYSIPNKLLEYAFAGVPVLASRLPEIQRVVEQYGLGMCCDNNEVAVEAAIRKIEREGIALSTKDLAELSWERQAERLLSAYRGLLNITDMRTVARA